MQLSQFQESQDSIKNPEISTKDIQKLEEFKTHYNNASPEEKSKIAEEFTNLVNPEISKLNNSFENKGSPEITNSFENQESTEITNSFENQESTEITNDDKQSLDNLRAFQEALKNYPNIPSTQRDAIYAMVYGPIRAEEEQIWKFIIDNNKSDKNIES